MPDGLPTDPADVEWDSALQSSRAGWAHHPNGAPGRQLMRAPAVLGAAWLCPRSLAPHQLSLEGRARR